ncbi:MAG: SNARE-like domain protein [Phycisphaeraceae bacterium]|nr:SNARE-like domain protein [Phycisphaeraceae bacterium]
MRLIPLSTGSLACLAMGFALSFTTVVPAEAPPATDPALDLIVDRDAHPWWQIAVIAAATFVSEDLTCISAGLLANRGQLELVTGLLGCFIGIFLGDIGLWCLGRFLGRRLLELRWVARKFPPDKVEQVRHWLNRHSWWAVFASRFMPGTRLPLYVTAGTLGVKAWRFALWALISDMAWTPLLVVSVALLGEAAARPFEMLFGPGWIALVCAVLTVWLLIRAAIALATRRGRQRAVAKLSTIWRWEFWPAWLFYAPLVPWLALLACRHRSLTAWTAANPGIPDGGVVGESKHAILARLDDQWVVPFGLVGAGDPASRLDRLRAWIVERSLAYPLVLKPDAGQRGFGVRIARSDDDATAHFSEHPYDVLIQQFDPGPLEAGVFYVREPDEPTGRIFSITDKHFPAVTGDGIRTLEALIWDNPRLRMQAGVFLARHAARRDEVVERDRRFPLAMAGNHCQGTMFKDGAHLATPELAETIDRIAHGFPGFFFGRFDVRYEDAASLRAGRDFRIIELNGVTSESTNIYDPDRSLLWAYRTLARQWALLYRIGDANRRRGHRPARLGPLVKSILSHYRLREGNAIAD